MIPAARCGPPRRPPADPHSGDLWVSLRTALDIVHPDDASRRFAAVVDPLFGQLRRPHHRPCRRSRRQVVKPARPCPGSRNCRRRRRARTGSSACNRRTLGARPGLNASVTGPLWPLYSASGFLPPTSPRAAPLRPPPRTACRRPAKPPRTASHQPERGDLRFLTSTPVPDHLRRRKGGGRRSARRPRGL